MLFSFGKNKLYLLPEHDVPLVVLPNQGSYCKNLSTAIDPKKVGGAFALDSNTEGSSNTAIGRSALAFNLIGIQNTAIGMAALLNTKGNNNTAIGYQALRDKPTGNNNTGIGSGADDVSADNLTNATAIGAKCGGGCQ